MRKNLIVKIRMKSGKEHYLESRSFENGHLKEFVEDVESFRPVFMPVDGDNLVRWSEVESLADVSHLENSKVYGEIKVNATELKVGHSEEDIEKIGEYFAKEFEKRK